MNGDRDGRDFAPSASLSAPSSSSSSSSRPTPPTAPPRTASRPTVAAAAAAAMAAASPSSAALSPSNTQLPQHYQHQYQRQQQQHQPLGTVANIQPVNTEASQRWDLQREPYYPPRQTQQHQEQQMQQQPLQPTHDHQWRQQQPPLQTATGGARSPHTTSLTDPGYAHPASMIQATWPSYQQEHAASRTYDHRLPHHSNPQFAAGADGLQPPFHNQPAQQLNAANIMPPPRSFQLGTDTTSGNTFFANGQPAYPPSVAQPASPSAPPATTPSGNNVFGNNNLDNARREAAYPSNPSKPLPFFDGTFYWVECSRRSDGAPPPSMDHAPSVTAQDFDWRWRFTVPHPQLLALGIDTRRICRIDPPTPRGIASTPTSARAAAAARGAYYAYSRSWDGQVKTIGGVGDQRGSWLLISRREVSRLLAGLSTLAQVPVAKWRPITWTEAQRREQEELKRGLADGKLWVDVLSVDQFDMDDVAGLVPMMTWIYECAMLVIVPMRYEQMDSVMHQVFDGKAPTNAELDELEGYCKRTWTLQETVNASAVRVVFYNKGVVENPNYFHTDWGKFMSFREWAWILWHRDKDYPFADLNHKQMGSLTKVGERERYIAMGIDVLAIVMLIVSIVTDSRSQTSAASVQKNFNLDNLTLRQVRFLRVFKEGYKTTKKRVRRITPAVENRALMRLAVLAASTLAEKPWDRVHATYNLFRLIDRDIVAGAASPERPLPAAPNGAAHAVVGDPRVFAARQPGADGESRLLPYKENLDDTLFDLRNRMLEVGKIYVGTFTRTAGSATVGGGTPFWRAVQGVPDKTEYDAVLVADALARQDLFLRGGFHADTGFRALVWPEPDACLADNGSTLLLSNVAVLTVDSVSTGPVRDDLARTMLFALRNQKLSVPNLRLAVAYSLEGFLYEFDITDAKKRRWYELHKQQETFAFGKLEHEFLATYVLVFWMMWCQLSEKRMITDLFGHYWMMSLIWVPLDILFVLAAFGKPSDASIALIVFYILHGLYLLFPYGYDRASTKHFGWLERALKYPTTTLLFRFLAFVPLLLAAIFELPAIVLLWDSLCVWLHVMVEARALKKTAVKTLKNLYADDVVQRALSERVDATLRLDDGTFLRGMVPACCARGYKVVDAAGRYTLLDPAGRVVCGLLARRVGGARRAPTDTVAIPAEAGEYAVSDFRAVAPYVGGVGGAGFPAAAAATTLYGNSSGLTAGYLLPEQQAAWKPEAGAAAVGEMPGQTAPRAPRSTASLFGRLFKKRGASSEDDLLTPRELVRCIFLLWLAIFLFSWAVGTTSLAVLIVRKKKSGSGSGGGSSGGGGSTQADYGDSEQIMSIYLTTASGFVTVTGSLAGTEYFGTSYSVYDIVQKKTLSSGSLPSTFFDGWQPLAVPDSSSAGQQRLCYVNTTGGSSLCYGATGDIIRLPLIQSIKYWTACRTGMQLAYNSSGFVGMLSDSQPGTAVKTFGPYYSTWPFFAREILCDAYTKQPGAAARFYVNSEGTLVALDASTFAPTTVLDAPGSPATATASVSSLTYNAAFRDPDKVVAQGDFVYMRTSNGTLVQLRADTLATVRVFFLPTTYSQTYLCYGISVKDDRLYSVCNSYLRVWKLDSF
ncbi:hypothetical protein DFJ73DRAFT_768502 [Zopfochytrium polystomum]|nr:hypothetical protein DFJ73DRAFT_768502 [Zopfochytrium polystomum]